MGKNKRPIRRATNREGLQEYLKSLETTTEQKPDSVEGTKFVVDEPKQQGETFDTLFTEQKPIAPTKDKLLPDNFRQNKPATSDTFDSFLKTTEIQETTKQPLGQVQTQAPLTPEQIKLQEYGNNLQAIRTEIETRMKDLDKTDKLQVDEVNELVKKFEQTSNQLKKEFPIFTLHPAVIDNAFQNYPGYKQTRTELSAYDPTKWTKFGIDEPLTGKKVTDQQAANNYQLLTRALNGNISVNQAEKESSIWGTQGGRMAGSMIQGVVSIPDGFVAFGEMVSDELGKVGVPGADKLKTQFQMQGMQLKQILDGVSPADPNFAEQLSSGVGSMLAFMIPGSLAANFGKVAGLTPKVANWLGIGTSTILESVTEAGNVYRESGDSNAATKTLLANLFLIAITNRFGVQGDKQRSLLKSMLTSMPLEGLQEGMQEIISDASQGKEMNLENILTSTAIGTIIGGGTSFATGEGTNDISSGNDPNQQTPPISPVVSPTAGEVIPPVTSPNQDTFETLNVDPAQVNQEAGFTNFQFEDQTNDEKITEPGIEAIQTSTKEAAPIEEVKDKKEEIKQEPEKRVKKSTSNQKVEADQKADIPENIPPIAKIPENDSFENIYNEAIKAGGELARYVNQYDKENLGPVLGQFIQISKNDKPDSPFAIHVPKAKELYDRYFKLQMDSFTKATTNEPTDEEIISDLEDDEIDIEEEVNEAATSPKNDLPEPTQAQKEAGNYKKGHIEIAGFDISIENPRGSKRSGIDPDGNKWEVELKSHYGYFKRSKGKDGDQIDVFVNPDMNREPQTAFIVDQVNPKTKEFDEHKVMLGYDTQEAAKKAYLDNYAKGWAGLGNISEVNSLDDLKDWVKSGKTTKPFNYEKPVAVTKSKSDVEIKASTEGIEIRFPDKTKPDNATIEFMKNQGLRIKRGTNVWYSKYSKERETAINDRFLKDTQTSEVKENNFEATQRMFNQGKTAKQIAIALGTSESAINQNIIYIKQNKVFIKQIGDIRKSAVIKSGMSKDELFKVIKKNNLNESAAIEVWNEKLRETKAEKPKAIENNFDPKPTYENILSDVNTANDKNLMGKTRATAKKEMAASVKKLLQNGIAAQVKSSGGKWNLYIDGVKQNRRSLGLVEAAEKVKAADITIENENAKTPFSKLPDDVVRKQTVASKLVTAEDLPAGIGEAALKKGVEDIKEDSGKEQNPEAQIVRDAAENILKEGQERVVQVKGQKRQDLSAEEIKSFVDEQIQKENNPDKTPDYLKAARNKLADLENDVFATDAELTAAQKQLKAAENKFADESNKLIDVEPTKVKEPAKPKSKSKAELQFDKLIKEGSTKELQDYKRILSTNGAIAKEFADRKTEMIKKIDARINFIKDTKQDMFGAAEAEKQENIFDQKTEQRPKESFVNIKVYRGEGNNTGQAWNGAGKYYTDSRGEASLYGKVTEHTITLKNPIRIDQVNDSSIQGSGIVQLFASIKELKDQKFNGKTFEEINKIIKSTEKEVDSMKLYYSDGTNKNFKHIIYEYEGKDKSLHNKTEEEIKDKKYIKGLITSRILNDKYNIKHLPIRISEAINPGFFSEIAQRQGYDGVVAENSTVTAGNEFVVFEKPENKSSLQQKAEKKKDELDDAIADLLKEVRKPKLLSSIIPGVDPEALIKAVKVVDLYTKMNVYKFADIIQQLYTRIGEDARDLFEAMKHAYGAFLANTTDEIADQMDELRTVRSIDFDKIINEVSNSNKDQDNVSDRSDDSQQNSRDTRSPLSDNEEIISGQREGSRSNRVEDNESDTGEGIDTEGSLGTSGSATPAIGTSGDNELSSTDKGSRLTDTDAGNSDGRGSDWISGQGEELQFDDEGEAIIEEHNKDVSQNFKERTRLARIKQKQVEKVSVKLLDRKNIEETLPYLLPAQLDDVELAEKRFFNKEHLTPEKAYGKGIMFTNGTGTGKTFSGLGIVKRFVKQGKNNILIVTPTQPKVNDWINEGKELLLNITALNDTADQGKGVNVTTFANFRANEAIKNRDFDLIIYDESHRIMESKSGDTSSTTHAHYQHGNASEYAALSRLQDVHPLWIEHRALNKRFTELNKALNNDTSGNPVADEKEVAELNKKIAVLDAKMAKVEPALKERAAQAYKNTKVVFLSATPFKAHFNLRYANRFLFDWGSEITYESASRGQSRVDPESRFYLDNFGAAYTWKYHQLQSKPKANPEAIAMQEIAFNEKLKSEGVLSARIIDSEFDYSRDFPVVAGFDNGVFNKAFNDIFNYSEDAQFQNLRSAAADVFMDYNYTTQLFESMKAGLSIERIQKHLDLNRKVVIFHRRQQGNASAPFIQILERANNDATATYNDPEATPESKEKAKETLQQVLAFGKKYSNLLDYEQTIDYRSAVTQLSEIFKGKIAFVNGNVSAKDKIKAIRDFNDDNGKIQIIMAQEDAGKEGISLHDTSEKNQRVLMSLSMPISSTTALQIEGRIYRIGQASDAIFEYPLLGLDLEVAHFGQNINKKVSTTENLALGELSRDLLRSYSEGVLFNSTTAEPNKEQGKGGKDYDKKSQKAAQSEFQRAKLVYETNQKIRGSRDNRKGIDFYPTPEPLGQKMIEWANVKEDESVLEPSAGNGAIAMWVPKNITLTAVEPSFDLFSKLSARASGSNRKIVQSTFEDFNIINKVNAVVMNPPFGAAGTTALQHLQKAYHHLKNGGRIVALVPRGAFDTKFEKWQNDDNFPKDLYVRSRINLPAVTFEQAGTKINAQIIILDKFANAEDAGVSLYQSDLDFTSSETINEFFDNIENVTVANRSEVPNVINHPSSASSTEAPKEGELATVASFNHTQTKAKIYVVKLNDRVSAENYYAANDKAKKFGGRYSKFSRDGAIPGFLFKNEATANEVANWINKNIGESNVENQSVLNVKLYQALIKMDVIGGKEIKALAAATGKTEQSIKTVIDDLKTKRLLTLNPNRDLDVTEEFKTLLSDINENPEKYTDDYAYLYSNPLPVMIKGLGKIQKVVDDLWSDTIGEKVYKGLGKGLSKITPERLKEIVITNYGLPAEYTVLKREALDAIQRYQELARTIADNLKYSDVANRVKFTEAEQMRLSQLVKGGISNVPVLRQRAEMAIREIKELEKLGRELETLPIETYNTKLSRARINELLQEKREFEKQRQKIVDKFGEIEEDDKDSKKALKRATGKLDEKISSLDKKIKDSYLHGNEGYLKRVYLSKEQEKRLSKYGLTRPTRLDLTSAMHRKDIPFKIRKELGEILTAAYPAAKGIMLEGKDVSLGNFFKVISENPDWSSETEVINWKQLPKDRKLGKLSEMWVEPKIFADINDVIHFTDKDQLNTFLKQINAHWKATKTIMNPATHFRNIFSNFIMLDFSGVSILDTMRLIPEAIKAIRGNGKYAQEFKASRLDNTTFNTQELGQYLDLVQENQGTGFMGMRGLNFGEAIVKLYGKVSLVDTKVGETMGKVYQMEEVLGKAIKFIAERENGKTINEARNEANKWLFDYSDVPSIVRKLRTNPVFGLPFVTWSYKAFPRIIEAAMTRPIAFWKYPVIFSALMKYALEAMGIDDDDWEKIKADLPDRMLKGEWLLLPFKDENGKMQMLDLTYILPYKDVYDVIASGFTLASTGKFNNDDDIVDGLVGLFQAPILKSAAELIANKNTYTNTPIWLDVDTANEKLVKASDYMYKTFMPSLAPEIPFVTEGGYSYHKMRSVISGRDDYYGRTFGFAPAVSSSFLGLKTSPIEMEKNIDNKLYKLQDQLNQLALKRNKMLRDESLTEETRLERSLEVDQTADQIREKIQNLNIPVKNPEINETEKAVRKLQNILNDVPIEQKEKRKEFNKKINLLKIKLNNMMSDPDAYTGDFETKEDRINAKNRKSLTRDSNKSLSKSLSR